MVEPEVGVEVRVRFDLGAVAPQVDLLVVDRAPEPLDEDVVQGPAAAIHRELHAAGQQGLGKLCRGKLAALIGVEEFRHSVLGNRPLDGVDAAACIDGVRQLPDQHHPALPVDDGTQVDEAALDRDKGYVHPPQRVGADQSRGGAAGSGRPGSAGASGTDSASGRSGFVGAVLRGTTRP